MKVLVSLFAFLSFATVSHAQNSGQQFERIVVAWFSPSSNSSVNMRNRQLAIDEFTKSCQSWNGAIRISSIINLTYYNGYQQVGGICQLPTVR